MTKFKNPLAWVHGFIGAFIGGGASALSGGLGVMLTDPAKFNLQEPKKLLIMMAWTFLFSGLPMAMIYLKQSPLPPIETSDTNPPFKPE